jgi:hypothetical protein
MGFWCTLFFRQTYMEYIVVNKNTRMGKDPVKMSETIMSIFFDINMYMIFFVLFTLIVYTYFLY